MTDVTILATGLGFPEGPVVCADGSVVLTEIRNNKGARVTPDGKVSVFSECGGGPNGLAIGPDGFFYLCNNGGSRYVEGTSMGQGPHPDYKFGWVQRIDPKPGDANVFIKRAMATWWPPRTTLSSTPPAASTSPTWASAMRGTAITADCIMLCRMAR